MNKENKESFIEKNLWWLLLIVGIVFLSVYFWKFHGVLANESDKWDHFGSYIGGIFSGMAFLALIAEMKANKKEKKLQEERYLTEMRANKKEKKLQEARYLTEIEDLKKEKDEQDKRWKKEDFERTFFMMLSQFNEKLSFLNNSDINNIYDSIVTDSFSYFNTIRNNVENEKYSDINMLFINLYRILKFIDESHFEINNKKLYTGILRSYLSRKFLVVLGFHLLYRDSSYNNYIEYINKYNIFEHIGLKYLEIKVIKNNLKLTNNLNNSIKDEKYKTIIDYILIKKDGYNIKNTYNNPDLNKIIKTKLSKPSKKICNKFIQARIKGTPFKIPGKINESGYDFIFMHLIANFKPEAFANSLEYRDTTTVYNLYISKLKNTYS